MELGHNKASAGNFRNMRDAKHLTKKSAADMAAIFGVRADDYPSAPPPLLLSHVDPKRRTTSTDGGDDGGNIANRKKSRRDTKRDDDYSSSVGAANEKKKRSGNPSGRGGGHTPHPQGVSSSPQNPGTLDRRAPF